MGWRHQQFAGYESGEAEALDVRPGECGARYTLRVSLDTGSLSREGSTAPTNMPRQTVGSIRTGCDLSRIAPAPNQGRPGVALAAVRFLRDGLALTSVAAVRVAADPSRLKMRNKMTRYPSQPRTVAL